MLQDISTGRCLHLTWRFTWWASWPSLWALADQCNFPTEEEKEWNVQYRFIRALNDKELVKKLLALDLTAMAAISDNLEAMGLNQKKSVNVIWKQSKPHHGKKPQADSVHSCGHCTKFHPPGRSSCPAWEDKCQGCGKLGHWKPKCWSSLKGTQNKGHPHQEKGENPRRLVKLELMTTTVIRWVLQLSYKHHRTVIPTLYTFLMFE